MGRKRPAVTNFLLLLTGVFLANTAKALDGKNAHYWCSLPRNGIEYLMLVSYIEGVSDTIYSFTQARTQKLYCAPSSLSRQAMTDTVCVYLLKYPERRQYLLASSIKVAFTEAFPCK